MFGVLETRCVSIGIRAVMYSMALENQNSQAEMEDSVQEIRRLAVAVDLINKKQDKTDQVLAALQERQARLLELGSKSEGNYKRQTQNQSQERGKTNLKWVCRKEYKDRRVYCDEGCHEDSNWKVRRLELPSFNGQEVDDWILKAEKYFSHYQLSEKQKMEVLVVCLEGEAMMWYKYANQRLPMRRWEDLKNLILERFRPFEDGVFMNNGCRWSKREA